MHRTRGKVIGVVVGIAATGLLAACGNNDSTATSTPTMSHTTTAAATPSASTSAAATGQPSAAPETPADTATPERPQPVPTNTAPGDTSKLTDKDKKFLDALKAAGITPSSPDIALSIGTYVCQGVAANASDQDLMTFATAMAGSDPSFDPAKMPVEQAGKIYIDTAKSTYCQ
ncbi:DUF732 domain-containing protein [Nocardia sp. NPDC049526]|uniref:DUF732 domain-containing protein n=1 Tax=Nocardia sp. NPDC049526 TaxID=3364316 RepID=UPI0037B1061A